MSVRRSGIGSREDAVHAPVVVDAVHGLYHKYQKDIERGKEQKEKEIPQQGRGRPLAGGPKIKLSECGLCAQVYQ